MLLIGLVVGAVVLVVGELVPETSAHVDTRTRSLNPAQALGYRAALGDPLTASTTRTTDVAPP